jgi:predicted RNA-binding Zn-ribbon protein involved in translation (DUF1610 family)
MNPPYKFAACLSITQNESDKNIKIEYHPRQFLSQVKIMAQNFNCPNCGASNEYSGEGDTVKCAYCGQDIHPPADMVNQAAVARFSSKAKVWIILFIVVVFVIPTCLTLGGTLLGIFGTIIGIIFGILGSFIGLFTGH